MKNFLFTPLILFLQLPGLLSAQSVMYIRNGCAVNDAKMSQQHYLFDPSDEARCIINTIMEVNFLKPNFVVKSGDVENAIATIEGDNRYIIYNTTYIERIKRSGSNVWPAFFVFAHEIGHHLNNHRFDLSNDIIKSKEQELQADMFAGGMLYRLGATLDEAQQGIGSDFKEKGSNTHPPRKARLEAIASGWKKAYDQSGGAQPKYLSFNCNQFLQPIPTSLAQINGHQSAISAMAISNNESLLASGSDDGKIKLWKFTNYNAIQSYKEISEILEDKITSLIFLSDNKTLIATSFQGEMILWDTESEFVVDHFFTGEQNSSDAPITDAALSPDEKTIALSCNNGNVILLKYDSKSRKIEFYRQFSNSESGESPRSISTIRFIPNTNYLITASNDYYIRLWDIKDNKLLSKNKTIDYITGLDLFITNENKLIITAGLDMSGSELWQLNLNSVQTSSWEKRRSISNQQFDILDNIFSLDKKHIITSSTDGTFMIYNWEEGKEILKISTGVMIYTTLAIQSEKGLIIAGTKQGELIIWHHDDLILTTSPKLQMDKGRD